MRYRGIPIVLLSLALVAAACRGGGSSGRVKVVASFYPLAWAARAVGGPNVWVEDVTPSGGEAHDATLTAGQRADLQDAAVVFILGDFGFQPQVEAAAADARGTAVAVTRGMALHASSEADLRSDPHVWLDPVLMASVVEEVARALETADPENAAGYRSRADATLRRLAALDRAYSSGLGACPFSSFVVTHEAFGYLASRYGLAQVGIEGLIPGSEPTAGAVELALTAIRDERAAPAVFYEATDEGRRIGESVAGDAGVTALPLGTLEAAPETGNYLSGMRANLAMLRKGLRCS